MLYASYNLEIDICFEDETPESGVPLVTERVQKIYKLREILADH